MDRIEEFRSRAEQAEREVERASTAAERVAYEKIAKSWRDLERQALAKMKRGV